MAEIEPSICGYRERIWRHRLSNLDIERREADCLKCGRVSILRKSGQKKTWMCRIARNERRGPNKKRSRGRPDPPYPCPDACEACGRKQTRRKLNLDHCHETGKFRGWLCDYCNRGLGLIGDNLLSVMNLAAYLGKDAPDFRVVIVSWLGGKDCIQDRDGPQGTD